MDLVDVEQLVGKHGPGGREERALQLSFAKLRKHIHKMIAVAIVEGQPERLGRQNSPRP